MSCLYARLALPLLLLIIGLPAFAGGANNVLDAFHRAAAEADLDTYFSLLTEEVVFLGTDGTERWQGDEFREFARPHFESGRGWEYRPLSRNVAYSEDGDIAWFDEALEHDKLGHCRSSGVLQRVDGQWKVAQYNLSVPVPNGLVLSVVEQIQAVDTDAVAAPEPAAIAEEPAEKRASCRKKRHKTNKPAGC
ncbi:DUF4440 domain-containing protein [Halioglobus maricola]|uniref:DUF4440 domain-containing protein n=1 Tax=Halioglobus maricola TaxID=2601894 RepID=A0A5P9NHJ6_9GAMM|nr:nuclear transport factor 2 family protein [Halioglobus maricola]QFU75297.1 DUF4440 domain-containing protein [Halioglobus maricola]